MTAKAVIEFTCRYGSGRGVWSEAAPQLGREYHVEIDIDQPLHIGVNTKATDDEVPRIEDSGSQVTLVARIESLFDDGAASLRLGDSLILVALEGAFPTIGSWVKVSLPHIKVYEMRL